MSGAGIIKCPICGRLIPYDKRSIDEHMARHIEDTRRKLLGG